MVHTHTRPTEQHFLDGYVRIFVATTVYGAPAGLCRPHTTHSSEKCSRWTQLWWCACTLAALCIYMPRLGSFIQGQQQTYRPFRGKSCLSRNRNLVFFFGVGMLLWSLFCCCVATNHLYDALTMNIIADVLIVTRIPAHLSSTAIFLARHRGTCNCLQSDHTVHILVETKIWSYLPGNNCSFRCVYTRAVYILRWGKMGPIFSLIDYIF